MTNPKSVWPELLGIPEEEWDYADVWEKISKALDMLSNPRPIVNRYFDKLQEILHAELFQYGFYVPLSVLPFGSLPVLAELLQNADGTQISNFLGSSDKCVRGQVYGIYFECEECLISKTVGLPLQCLDFVVRGFQGSG